MTGQNWRRAMLHPRDPDWEPLKDADPDPDRPEDIPETWDGPPDYEGTGGDPK